MSVEIDGAEYLRRLKEGECPPQPPVLPEAMPAQPPTLKGGQIERRMVPRYKCQGSAQVRQEHSEVTTWGSITDIGVHGCYLEMTSTFPVGTMVFVNLKLVGLQVQVKGEVRATYPFLGMGIAFREVADATRQRLVQMVGTVAREVRLVVPHLADTKTPWRMPEIADPKSALAAIQEYFRTHTLLSRDDLVRLLSAPPAAS